MNRILKLEHFAENIVFEFFHAYQTQSKLIQCYVVENNSLQKQPFTPELLYQQFGIKAYDTKHQLKVKDTFCINSKTSNQSILKAGIQNLDFDDQSCFDCALTEKKLIVPIEVKSGISEKKYGNLNKTLSNSRTKKPIHVDTTPIKRTLSGDMINLFWKNQEEAIMKGLHGNKLANGWILVLNNYDQVAAYVQDEFGTSKDSLTESMNLKIVFTLEDIVKFGVSEENIKRQITLDLTSNLESLKHLRRTA